MADSTVRVLFLGNAGSALRSVRSVETSFSSLGRAAGLAGTAIAAGLVGGLTLAVKAAVDFDREMRNVNSIAKLSESQFKTLSKSVLGLAKETGQAPKTLAQGLYDIVSSGFKANQGIKILRVSAKAATAGLTDTATATKAVVASLNAYHLGAKDAARVGDILFQTVNKGVLTFEELSQQIGDVLPAASTLGVPLEAVGGALATITLHGVNAAEAATQVKQVLVSMLKPSEGLQKEFKALGFESGQAALKQLGLVGVVTKLSQAAGDNKALIADWFPNVRALSGFFGLAGKNIQQFTSNVDAMNSKGALAKAFAEQGKSIAVQWQKAKSALTAAAIPLGQLLFPLLAKAAGGVEDFSRSIQIHMPMIREQFGSLAGAARGVASSLADIGGSRQGQVLLAGLASAFAGGKLTSGMLGLAGALKTMNPLIIGGAVAVGLLGGAIFAGITRVTALEQGFYRAAAATRALTQALNDQRQAHLTAKQASTALESAQLGLEAAHKTAATAIQQFGRKSLEARQAINAERQASDNLKQAKQNLKTATQAAADEDAKAAAKHKEHAEKLAELRRNIQDAGKELSTFGGRARSTSGDMGTLARHEEAINKAASSGALRDYAKAFGDLTKEMGGTAGKAKLAEQAVIDLFQALGRLPTRKEVNIIVTEEQRSQHLGHLKRTGRGAGSTNRAVGGFIPGSPGEAVPVMAHAGEIILNQGQQAVLGGPRFLSQLFGFHGDRGPSFAAGGIVRKPKRRKSGHSPHATPRKRARTASGKARAMLKAVDGVNQAEADADRGYGQLVRGYDISQEVFIRTDENGIDYVSQPDIDQRVGEIDDLINARGHMLDLLDSEKRELKAAIARLRTAITALVKAIRAEQKAIRKLNGQVNRERKKKKPNQNLISSWQGQISGHESNISGMQGTISDFKSALGDSQHNLRHVLPYDRTDVQQDISTLQGERVDVSGTKLPTSGGAGGGVDQGNIDELLRQIGQLKFALGIQGAQGAIIGAFQKGTINVPETGLALVHAGESITPAGYPRGLRAAGEGSPVQVNVILEGDKAASFLKDFVRVEAVNAAGAIDRKIQRAQDGRIRSGVAR